MATTTWQIGQTSDPDPELAALCLGLASALLRDRQYKLGGEMLGHAMQALEPQGLQDVMTRIYRDIDENLWESLRLGDWEIAEPLMSRDTMTLRVAK